MIGKHVAKLPDPLHQRSQALLENLDCLQTMVGNPKSLYAPTDILRAVPRQPVAPLWFWHAAYVASVNPAERNQAQVSEYLSNLINNADKFHICGIVVHTGASVGQDSLDVTESMFSFLEDYSLCDLLGQSEVQLAIELGASNSQLNSEPEDFIKSLAHESYQEIGLGWCLDLAHCYAAGISWDGLANLIAILPPIVCHCNFAGSHAGSGQDIHGWRSHPTIVGHGRSVSTRPKHVADHICGHFDETLKLLQAEGVPLIIEGSNFPQGSIDEELETIRGILA